MVCIDPRVFALHKTWLSRRFDRDPVKKRRDLEQARAAALLATGYLGLSFDERSALSATPAVLRKLIPDIEEWLARHNDAADERGGKLVPDW